MLNPFISANKEKGIPTFLLSNNLGKTTGIQQISYGTQSDAVEAGAIPLKDVNYSGTLQVVDEIQLAANQGKTGEELSRAITRKFGTPIPQKAT